MRVLAAVLLILAGACSAPGGSSIDAPSSANAIASNDVHAPIAAGAFADSIGINTHLGFDLTLPQISPVLVERFRELGVRHVRDGIFPRQPASLNRLERAFFATTGADMLALTDCPKPLGYYSGSQTPPNVIRAFARDVGGAVAQLEGPNEPDLRGVEDWANLTRTCMQHDAGTLGLPFVAPAMGYPPHARGLGNVSSLVTIGAIHRYFSGHNPGTLGFWKRTSCGWWEAMATDVCEARINAGPSAPLWITETGYTDDGFTGSPEGEGRVDRTTAAKYISRVLFIDAIAGIARTYLYELHDGATGTRNPENGYGLLAYDGTPKPAYFAVRNTLALLRDPGPPPTLQPLPFHVNGPAKTTVELFEKRDGAYVLAIWNEVPSWNWNSGVEIPVRSQPVNVRFAQPPSALRYEALDDGGILVSQGVTLNGRTATFDIDDHVGFLEITP